MCVLCFFVLFVLFVFFVLFVSVKSSCKKKIKRFKIPLRPSFTILLTCTPLNLPMESYLSGPKEFEILLHEKSCTS